MRKDKEKVIDEVWTEDHVRSFLNARSYDGSNEDFHMLLKAYQSMRASDFELFVGFFKEQGRDINATSREGNTVLAVVSTHRHGAEYADILREAGAGA
ncbi:MAG: PA4642 family protein [Halioglobus sp.]